ncbi:transmembrane and coiled-coil domain-containing protein 6 isoform X3 [Colius striatus]|uniref:transmembrane and coiled-coil domain-containing protein 6 isoform X3 n=1 Tax=Colius striatus TaxID=57412 RepID=UPI002B1E8C68|nr:transmembrane and coiled-coil domain-containing protein 6 isoform X3 [Colius striatus]
MWGRRLRRAGRGAGRGAEELRARRREREAALRRARRQEQLVSKRLLRDDAAEDGARDGAEVVPGPLSEDEVLQLLRGVQRGSEDRKRCLGRLRWALRDKDTQHKFVRLEGSIRTLTGLFTSSLAELQMEAARCLHELSHSSEPGVAEACLPLTSYLLTYLSGHSVEFTELCLYTLGNLVVESEAVRKQLLPQGIIAVLASCIQPGAGLGSAPAHAAPAVCPQHRARSGRGVRLVPPLHNLQLVCPVLRCLGNLLAEESSCEVQIQDERLLITLFLILQCFLPQHPFIVQEGLWLLNNLTADEPFFCAALLSLDLLPALLQLLPCFPMTTVLALRVLCNVAEKGPEYCQQLHQPALPLLLPTLALPDPEPVGHCLELLHLLFLHCPEATSDFVRMGGPQALERHRSSPELQERAEALLAMLPPPPPPARSPCPALS